MSCCRPSSRREGHCCARPSNSRPMTTDKPCQRRVAEGAVSCEGEIVVRTAVGATRCQSSPRTGPGRMVQGARRVRRSVEALGDQRPQQGAPDCSSRDQGTCPRLGGRNAGAIAHHYGAAVGKGAHDTAHVLSGRGRPRGDRIERRCGPSARLVAQPPANPARSRPDRRRQAGRHGEAGVGARTRAAVGRDHGHVRRLRPLPGADNATDTGRPSHTRRPARRTSPINRHVEAARSQRQLDAG